MNTTITAIKGKADLSTRNAQESAPTAIVHSTPANSEEPLPLPGREVEETQARNLHAEWMGLQRKSLAVAIKLGGILSQLKAELKKATPKRNWEPYVREHLGIEPRSARNYMRLHRDEPEIKTPGNLLKSETVSEIGIRSALNCLAELNKIDKEKSKPTKDAESSGETKSAARTRTSGPPHLRLADDRLLDLKKAQWVDGLIPLHSIESWISSSSPKTDEPGAKLAARQQAVVIQIAAGINRGCGRAKADTAIELAGSAIEAVRNLLSEGISQ